jgi:hypothetical protein
MEKPEAEYDNEDKFKMAQQMKQRVSFSAIFKLFDFVYAIRADLDSTISGAPRRRSTFHVDSK